MNEEMLDGWPHRRRFRARFDDGLEVVVTEWWDEDGTVDREVAVRYPGQPTASRVTELFEVI